MLFIIWVNICEGSLMADRNSHSNRNVNRTSMFCFFAIIVLVCILSWFFYSANSPNFDDPIPLKNSIIFETIDVKNSRLPNVSNVQIQRSKIKSAFSPCNDNILEKEERTCKLGKGKLKVYMYDLPSEFHFRMLDWKGEDGQVWPNLYHRIPPYPGGLNLQHSVEYWLTLDLLSSRYPNRPVSCSAIRVDNSSQADVIFVPFFSSLSYNRYSKVKKPRNISTNRMLQEKLVEFLSAQDEWRRSGGKDHVIVAHHPNSMLYARMKLWPAMFILADFGRYPPNIANIEKDIIAPYKHLVKNIVNDTSTFESRPTLLYFQGAIYRKDGGYIRQELYYLLKDEEDVHFSFGSVGGNGINKASNGMHSSKFCLNIAGDTPSSNRLFDAIASHCVPVIISDSIELPYEEVLDYSEFCIFIRTSDALKPGRLMKLIKGVGRDEWTRMWKRLKEVEKYFEFHYPSQEDDAVQMIWWAVANKIPAVRLKIHRSSRFSLTMNRN